MANATTTVIGGVDTHKHVHHAAVITAAGELVGTREFRANHGGYDDLLEWMKAHGSIDAIGVEGTGSYGASLTKFLNRPGFHREPPQNPGRFTKPFGNRPPPALTT